MSSLCWGVSSCINTKKAIYFRDQGDGAIRSSTALPETIIQNNDIISIQVSSLNQDASSAFNVSNREDVSATTLSGSRNETAGYLVSAYGYITFPILGDLRVAGMTKTQLTDTLTGLLNDRKLLVNPIVTVRMLNFKVTVLGEVGHPSVIPVPSEKISLLEALGLAGDLTINARRDNVMIIREESGRKVIKRINLNSSDLFTSPFYYLQTNDVVYVEPNKAKVRSGSNTAMWVSVVLAALSFGIIAVTNIK
ncbi:MAG TPA: polysaccharide biosynthesis/export family protein [Puia sp.]|nr:polysaccharide biosynthesis/export family protein [Puia sp.]